MIWSNVTTTNGTTSSTTESTTISSKSTKEKDAKKSSTLDVNDFLSLLVTEMQYQDPLEPTDNSQYIAQMATFSQVEATKGFQTVHRLEIIQMLQNLQIQELMN